MLLFDHTAMVRAVKAFIILRKAKDIDKEKQQYKSS
jgi:hypothetical protein